MSGWPDGLTEQQVIAWANDRGFDVLFTTGDEIPLIFPRHAAQVVYLPGDGSAWHFADHETSGPVPWTPMQRAVAVARLKVLGDLIAASDESFGSDGG